MEKKGAINLSINMIIVLIIAIVILGFALSFVTNMFSETQEKFEGLFPSVEVPVDADNPIGIGENFRIQGGDSRKISMNIFNTLGSDLSTGQAAITCSGTAPTVENIQPITISPGDVKEVKAIIRGTIGMKNNDICTIAIGELEQSFFLVTQ